MSSKDNPCRNCDERCAGCHGRCDLYREWNAEHKRQKEAYRQYKSADDLCNAYAKETHARIKRAKEGRTR